MNPTQNDDFGSFGTPSGGFGGGNPQVNGGSIVVGGPVQKSGHKKWWAILIVVLLLAAIGGGAFALWKSGVFGGGGTVTTGNSVKVAFNEYANYVLLGRDSKDDVTEEMVEESEPFFESITDIGEMNQYLKKVNEKYEKLESVYYSDSGYEDDDLFAIKVYFQEFPSINEIDGEDLLLAYKNTGINVANEMIEEAYYSVELGQPLEEYVNTLKDFAEAQLQMYIDMDKAGCLGTDECYGKTDGGLDLMLTYIIEIDEMVGRMRVMAREALIEMYSDIYGIKEVEG